MPVRGRGARTDAQRNRETILRAADRAFGERGVDAQMTDVAALAGLGMGTVYRHFPNKEALVDALLLDHFQGAERAALTASEEPDPWTGLERLVHHIAETSRKRYLSQFMGGRINGTPELQRQRLASYQLLADVVDAAKRKGQLRSDAEASDVLIATISLARAGWGASELAGHAVRRHLAIFLEGLRAPAQHPISDAPLQRTEFETLVAEFAQPTPAFRRGQRSR
ncbi:TetR family transcriptional regulator [Rhodococcus spelaei]|uniref:TetR family transcriptional regulator n=1 Tax=Rhodococcus spelaei TaxID=2546320 RepID=A0A541B213_9NOCA|nr:TetR/AcrR family transcriptional regulator [Rhodococcus spelaei]TQF66364.1 TetR family transcriptional regulator [Rhodococcus spelaei]